MPAGQAAHLELSFICGHAAGRNGGYGAPPRKKNSSWPMAGPNRVCTVHFALEIVVDAESGLPDIGAGGDGSAALPAQVAVGRRGAVFHLRGHREKLGTL